MPKTATESNIQQAFQLILQDLIQTHESKKDQNSQSVLESLEKLTLSNEIKNICIIPVDSFNITVILTKSDGSPKPYLEFFEFQNKLLKSSKIKASDIPPSYTLFNTTEFQITPDSLLETKLSEKGLLKEGEIDTSKKAVITAASTSSQLDASSEENKDSFGENLNRAALLLGLFEAAANAQSVMTTMDLNLNGSENTYFLMNLVGGWICPIFCTGGTFTGLRPLLSFTVIIMAALDKVPAVNEKRKTLLDNVNVFFSKGIQAITKSVSLLMQN